MHEGPMRQDMEVAIVLLGRQRDTADFLRRPPAHAWHPYWRRAALDKLCRACQAWASSPPARLVPHETSLHRPEARPEL